jgi:ribosome-associated heat shock protein Hsp15
MPLPNWPSSRRSDQLRIDRFLFFIRLVKSRTIAQHVIDEGHVRIDGKRVEKSSEEVRAGSVVALPLHDQVRILRVLALPTRRGPASEARACYQELAGLGIDAKEPGT